MTLQAKMKRALRYVGKRVRIKTKTGAVLYGTVEEVKSGKLYLRTESVHPRSSKAHATFAPAILPLVLFDLLAIILLDGRPRRRRLRRL